MKFSKFLKKQALAMSDEQLNEDLIVILAKNEAYGTATKPVDLNLDYKKFSNK